MSRTRTTRICIICLLGSFVAGIAQSASGFSFSFGTTPRDKPGNDPRTTSNRPWGNIGTFKPGVPYEPPAQPAVQTSPYVQASPYTQATPFGQAQPYPQASPFTQNSYYIGASPGTGWYSAQLPTAASSATGGDPRVEIETEGKVFYEQQNLIYTVRVVSEGNLKTLDPVVPRVEGAVIEQLDGPVATTRFRHRNGGQEIVNTYRYRLTPLRSGEISIPPIRFTGTHVASRQWNGRRGAPASSTGESFSIAAEAPLKLEVLPADASVSPWLPLHDLKLRSHLSKNAPAKEGVPVTLTLELSAKGATGEQLPSLEDQLRSDQFRAYRDSTTTSSGISRNGKQLTGVRKETYTLIPLRDGWIRLPAVGVSWWDVDSDVARMAALPGQTSDIVAQGSATTPVAAAGESRFSGLFWAPIFIALGLIAGYWLGAFARTRPVFRTALQRSRSWLMETGRAAVHSTRTVATRLSPAVPLNRLRMGLALMMPKTVRLWMCTRCVEHEESPEVWCAEFRKRACQHLNIAPHTPLPAIAERIIETNPRVEPTSVRSLVQSLDSAMYGARELDFLAWKREFQQQVRPHLFRARRSRPRRNRNVLPALNPRSA